MKIVSGEKIPNSVLNGVLKRSKGQGIFGVFNMGFMLIALFETGSEGRAKRFFFRAQGALSKACSSAASLDDVNKRYPTVMFEIVIPVHKVAERVAEDKINR